MILINIFMLIRKKTTQKKILITSTTIITPKVKIIKIKNFISIINIKNLKIRFINMIIQIGSLNIIKILNIKIKIMKTKNKLQVHLRDLHFSILFLLLYLVDTFSIILICKNRKNNTLRQTTNVALVDIKYGNGSNVRKREKDLKENWKENESAWISTTMMIQKIIMIAKLIDCIFILSIILEINI